MGDAQNREQSSGQAAAVKRVRGRPFPPNNRANPGGRPKILAEWRRSPEAARLRDLAYEALEDAVQHAAETKDRIAAAKELLDRIEGRPVQAVTGEEGGPVRVDVGLADMLAKLVAE